MSNTIEAPTIFYWSQEQQKEFKPLTDKQLLVLRARFRLIDTPRNGVRISDAIREIYPETNRKSVNSLLNIVGLTWNKIKYVVESDFNQVALVRGNEATLPFNLDEMDLFADDKNRSELYDRLSIIPAYFGMQYDELVRYTTPRINRSGAINLLVKGEFIKDMTRMPRTRPGIDRLQEDMPHFLSDQEKYFLTGRMLSEIKNGQAVLRPAAITNLERIKRDFDEYHGFDKSINKNELENLYLKLREYLEIPSNERGAYFFDDDSDCDYLLSTISRQWNKAEFVARLLQIDSDMAKV